MRSYIQNCNSLAFIVYDIDRARCIYMLEGIQGIKRNSPGSWDTRVPAPRCRRAHRSDCPRLYLGSLIRLRFAAVAAERHYNELVNR